MDFLKKHEMEIVAKSPIHIGDGNSIGKKEYIYLKNKNLVMVPDVEDLYYYLEEVGLDRMYQDYILKGNANRETLYDWLRRNRVGEEVYPRFIKYSLDAGDTVHKGKDKKEITLSDISTFIKDPYGNPYIPGSSIKGMIRTALIVYEAMNNLREYERLIGSIDDSIARELSEMDSNREWRLNRKRFLKRELEEIEHKIFSRDFLDRKINKQTERGESYETASIMSGLIVSDSEPISDKNLTLCQKIDVSTVGSQNPLNIFRECLIPNTKIRFSISIDSKKCRFDIDYILKAINYFNDVSNRYFYSRFNRGNNDKNTVVLGGGVGFASKTVINGFFEESSPEVIQDIFELILGEKMFLKHKHDKDKNLGVSPHMCKCTKYKGKLYNMGIGIIREIK